MAAEIDMSNGKANIASVGGGKSCWHGLGQEITKGMSMAQIGKIAGLDWKVSSSPVMFKDHTGKVQTMDDTLVNYRLDTGAPLGIVSKDFKNVQPAQILEFFADFCKDNKMSMETAGSLRGGKTVWALAKLGKDYDFLLPGNDKIDSYLRLQTGFDAKRATDAIATTIRQVCANTERMINQNDYNAYKTPHTQVFDAAALKEAMGLLDKQKKITAQVWNELCKRKVKDAEVKAYFCNVMGYDAADFDGTHKDGSPLISTITKNRIIAMTQGFTASPGCEKKSAKGTAYGLLQSVTHFVDNVMGAKTKEKSERVNSMWFGAGKDLKEEALYLAATLAKCEELVIPSYDKVAA